MEYHTTSGSHRQRMAVSFMCKQILQQAYAVALAGHTKHELYRLWLVSSRMSCILSLYPHAQDRKAHSPISIALQLTILRPFSNLWRHWSQASLAD